MLPRRAGGCEWTMVAARVPSFTGAEAGVAQWQIPLSDACRVYADGEVSTGKNDISQMVVAMITTLLWTLMIIPDMETDGCIGLEEVRQENQTYREERFKADSKKISNSV